MGKIQEILHLAIDHAEIHKFERVQPSLNEVLSTVGEDNLKIEEVA